MVSCVKLENSTWTRPGDILPVPCTVSTDSTLSNWYMGSFSKFYNKISPLKNQNYWVSGILIRILNFSLIPVFEILFKPQLRSMGFPKLGEMSQEMPFAYSSTCLWSGCFHAFTFPSSFSSPLRRRLVWPTTVHQGTERTCPKQIARRNKDWVTASSYLS